MWRSAAGRSPSQASRRGDRGCRGYPSSSAASVCNTGRWRSLLARSGGLPFRKPGSFECSPSGAMILKAAVDAGTSERENRARQPARKETDVSWSLKGSYFETCSCDLMCPCNMSMDHGATYDFCRVTLVFNIKEGEIEGTDVSGLKLRRSWTAPRS